MGKKEIKALLLLIGLLVIFFVMGMMAERCTSGRQHSMTNSPFGSHGKSDLREVVRDTVVYVDTVRNIAPAPARTAVVRYKEVRVKGTDGVADSIGYAEPFVGKDSVEIVLPIEQRIYEDKDYTAYVSGYEASLDSIFVYPRREVVTTVIKKPPKRWHIGPSVGYGYTPQGFQPFIGVSLTFSVLSF